MHWMLMPLRRYAEFSGRSRRLEFWMWVLFQLLIGIGFVVIVAAIGGAAAISGDPGRLATVGAAAIVLYFLYLLVWLAFLVPSLAVTVRRLHDTDRSGWWIMLFWGPWLAMFVVSIAFSSVAVSFGPAPNETAMMALGLVMLAAWLVWFVGSLVLLVFLCLDGTRGTNRYGTDPKSEAPAQVFA